MERVGDTILISIGSLLKQKNQRPVDLFRSIDASGDGQVSAEELRTALAELGLKPTAEEFTAFMARIDKDNSGEVSFKEFEKAMKQAEKEMKLLEKEMAARRLAEKQQPAEKKASGLTMQDKEEFRQIFCLFKQLCRARRSDEPELVEWDESGNISVDELEQLLETVGMRISPGELEAMVKEIDLDGNGNIDFNEFCTTMTRKIQVEYSQDEIACAFQAFQRNAPEGLIRVRDLREALKTYMHKDMIDAEVDELIHHYKDCFVKVHGSDEEYFNFQDYIDLMSPIGGFGGD